MVLLENGWICPPVGRRDVLVIPTPMAWEGPKSTKNSAIEHLRGRAGQRDEPRGAVCVKRWVWFAWTGSLQAVLPAGMLAGLLGQHQHLSCSIPRAAALRKELAMAVFC